MKAAAIYARVSSDKQKEENTIASQPIGVARSYHLPLDCRLS
ncbi:hypothetical+protein [Methylocapsa aurea]